MRIDLFLFESGLARSRTEAKSLILSGAVKRGKEVIGKPSYDFSGDASELQISRENFEYVSRGGNKLKAALDEFSVSADGKICVDIGASSGGFTDCLLKHGASRVFAVDSGTMQLVDSLRRDERVHVMENYNARYMKSSDFDMQIELAVMDVSFISATYIIQAVFDLLVSGGSFVCLIKPQFEVGKNGLSKGGIVKSDKLRNDALSKVLSFAEGTGFRKLGVMTSPIKGGDGNIEYLAHFIKP